MQTRLCISLIANVKIAYTDMRPNILDTDDCVWNCANELAERTTRSIKEFISRTQSIKQSCDMETVKNKRKFNYIWFVWLQSSFYTYIHWFFGKFSLNYRHSSKHTYMFLFSFHSHWYLSFLCIRSNITEYLTLSLAMSSVNYWHRMWQSCQHVVNAWQLSHTQHFQSKCTLRHCMFFSAIWIEFDEPVPTTEMIAAVKTLHQHK